MQTDRVWAFLRPYLFAALKGISEGLTIALIVLLVMLFSSAIGRIVKLRP